MNTAAITLPADLDAKLLETIAGKVAAGEFLSKEAFLAMSREELAAGIKTGIDGRAKKIAETYIVVAENKVVRVFTAQPSGALPHSSARTEMMRLTHSTDWRALRHETDTTGRWLRLTDSQGKAQLPALDGEPEARIGRQPSPTVEAIKAVHIEGLIAAKALFTN